MARHARIKSETGIYHVMLRGVNKQQIFFDDQDYRKFIQILIECKKISSFEMYAYCLMDNHIHLLLKEKSEDISLIMKRIGCRFVYWYNAKYHRVGHLFQDRFRSEPVETDEYFLCVLRYIHKNPVAAGIVNECSEYKYSSYYWYFENGTLIDKDFALSLMNEKQFKQFHLMEDDSIYLDITDEITPVTDEEAEEIIKKMLTDNDIADFISLKKDVKKSLVKQLKNSGLSSRQIIEKTGLAKNLVEKVKT